jgi:hypothetical protein
MPRAQTHIGGECSTSDAASTPILACHYSNTAGRRWCRAAASVGSHESQLAQTGVCTAVTDDHVVEHLDPQDISGFDETSGQLDIGA